MTLRSSKWYIWGIDDTIEEEQQDDEYYDDDGKKKERDRALNRTNHNTSFSWSTSGELKRDSQDNNKRKLM